MGYTKLFADIIQSSVWQQPIETRMVWVTMIALADQHGEVMASVPGLAASAGVTIDQCEEALDVFLSPDKYSRTPDYEGRRIEPIDGGWLLLNHAKYREKQSHCDINKKAAERMRRKREREKCGAQHAQHVAQKAQHVAPKAQHVAHVAQHSVTGRNMFAMLRQAEAEAEAEAEEKKEEEGGRKGGRKRPNLAPSLDEVKDYCRERDNFVDPEQFHDHYQANGWKQANGNAIKDWKAAVRTWERNDFGKKRKEEVSAAEQRERKPAPLTTSQMRFFLRGLPGIAPRDVNDWPDAKVVEMYRQRMLKRPPAPEVNKATVG